MAREDDDEVVEYRTPELSEIKYTRAKPLVMQLAEPLEVDGVQYESLSFAPPTRRQMEESKREGIKRGKELGLKDKSGATAMDNDTANMIVIMRCAISPPLNPIALDNLSQPDYARILDAFSKNGFFGAIRK